MMWHLSGSDRVTKQVILSVLSVCALTLVGSGCGSTHTTSKVATASDDSSVRPNTTIASLVGTEWVQADHSGYLRIDAENVSGSDGCNNFGAMDTSGAASRFVFGTDGLISRSPGWALISSLRACLPLPYPAIDRPSSAWKSYVLEAQSLVIKTEAGDTLRFTRRAA